VAPPGEPKSLSVWAMEYLPSFFDDPRSNKEAADFPGDISCERYQSDDYKQRLMRDISSVEIAATAEDIAAANTLLVAAGFRVMWTKFGLIARDDDTSIILDSVSPAQIGMRKIEFVLNKPVPAKRTEQLGHSTLTVGPGRLAVWLFEPRH
jgi:hypothetical protein